MGIASAGPQAPALQTLDELQCALDGWSPQRVQHQDLIGPRAADRLSALLDRETIAHTGTLPPLWHWLYFHTWPHQQELGPDGHPAHGPLLPPLPQRRRMFAGGRVNLQAPLRIGQPASLTSEVVDVRAKAGTTGPLAFVTVRTTVEQDGEQSLLEEQDLVYRSGPPPAVSPRTGTTTQARPDANPTSVCTWSATRRFSPAQLFRFSALTANSHRIHYDADYARNVEGYREPVVQGPLLVLLMLDLAGKHLDERGLRTMSYRLTQPVFVSDDVTILGNDRGPEQADLAIHSATGQHATASLGYSR